MAKRNQYSFSKRQRELKKKKKQEEKRARKRAKAEGEEVEGDEPMAEDGLEQQPEEGAEEPESYEG
jgi:hypothetical protein